MRHLRAVLALLALSVLLAVPAQAQVNFGATAAVGDDLVFVGEPGNEIGPGVVYVYERGSGGWEEVARITAPDGHDGDGFGAAIALQDELVLVSSAELGAVYAFRRQGSRWIEAGRIEIEGGADADFGHALAVDAELVAVGAPGQAAGRGAVHVFVREGDAWRSVAELEGEGLDPRAPADDGGEASPEHFGAAVALDDGRLLVGAPGPATDLFLLGALGLQAPSGSAYAFLRSADGWERRSRLTADAEGSIFGYSVAMRGDRALVGAIGADGTAGRIHAYRWDADGGDWIADRVLRPFDAAGGAYFGAALAFDAEGVLVGAPGAGNREGRLYRFRGAANGEWSASTKVDALGLKWGAGYGAMVAAAGDVVVAGLPGDDYGAGTAVIMTRLSDGWARSRVMSPPRGLDPVTGGGLECVDGRAGIFECDGIDLVAFLPVHAMGGGRGVTTNDMWGWKDPETGREYAIVGLRDGTSFVDVTDPRNPVWVGKLPKPDQSPASLWRDIKVHADHAFIVADASGEHGVQIFDLTRLREFDGEPITFTQDAHYDRVHSSHNLFINQETAFAYAVGNSSGGETCGGGLHMINVEDPREPMFAGCFQHTGLGRGGTGQTHDVQCVVYHGPDERYQGREICFGSAETAVSIADVTDKRDPVAIGRATYPNVAYTHQGWLDEEHRFFYMNDEGDEVSGQTAGTRTLIFDVQDLEDPILVGQHVADSPATDHNLYVRGDRMYQSNYRSGLWVYDISDREQMRLLGRFDTVPWGGDEGMGNILTGAIGSWSNYPYLDSGVVAVTSGKEGLFLLRPRPTDDRP